MPKKLATTKILPTRFREHSSKARRFQESGGVTKDAVEQYQASWKVPVPTNLIRKRSTFFRLRGLLLWSEIHDQFSVTSSSSNAITCTCTSRMAGRAADLISTRRNLSGARSKKLGPVDSSLKKFVGKTGVRELGSRDSGPHIAAIPKAVCLRETVCFTEKGESQAVEKLGNFKVW